MIFIGIDPGKTGAVAVIDQHGRLISAALCPVIGKEVDEVGMSRLIDIATTERCGAEAEAFVGLEKVGARPGESLKGAFTFGQNVGMWRGILATLMLGWRWITPQAWEQRALSGESRPKDYKERKAAITRSAVRHWPELSERLALKKNQGIADAVWIAEHVRLTHLMEREKAAKQEQGKTP